MSKLINLSEIEALSPCKDRLDNYKAKYGERGFTRAQFMGLRSITHADKMWVTFRLINKDDIGKCAGEIAQTTLHIYEARSPGDLRPRRAAEAAVAGTVTQTIREQAWAARREAFAADAAAYAAAYAAYAAAYVAYAAYAAYAADAYAADAAAAAARGNSRSVQEKLNRKIAMKWLRKAGY